MTYNEVINSTPVVLVEFYASWCPHCQQMQPVVDGLERKFDGRIAVVGYDVDTCEPLDEQNRVESVPTFIIYRGGREVWRATGELSESELLNRLDEALR